MLAFDPIYGPGNRFRLRTAENQLKILVQDRESIISDWHDSPKWNDDRKYVEGEIAKVQAEYGRKEAELRQKIDGLDNKFEDRTVTLAAYGVILLGIGFLLQLGGTLWTALATKA